MKTLLSIYQLYSKGSPHWIVVVQAPATCDHQKLYVFRQMLTLGNESIKCKTLDMLSIMTCILNIAGQVEYVH